MNNLKIAEFKEYIYECAQEFRREANLLMFQLAVDFKFEIRPFIQFPKEVYRHYNNKGILRNEWSFYFHGSHCRFENLHTGQILEVLFTDSPEFGYIDPFFFHLYIKTTQKHQWLLDILNEKNIHEAFDFLVKDGVLSITENSIKQRLILAE